MIRYIPALAYLVALSFGTAAFMSTYIVTRLSDENTFNMGMGFSLVSIYVAVTAAAVMPFKNRLLTFVAAPTALMAFFMLAALSAP